MEIELQQSKNDEPCEVLCQKCHGIAATVAFSDLRRPAIVIAGFLGNITAYQIGSRYITKDLFDWIVIASMFNPQVLHALDPDLFGFICGVCEKPYCSKCWVGVHPVFDPDWSVWLDEFRGTCPEGHSQMVQD